MIQPWKRGTAAVEGKAQRPACFILEAGLFYSPLFPLWNKSLKVLRDGDQNLLPLGHRLRPTASRGREQKTKTKTNTKKPPLKEAGICSEARPLKTPYHWRRGRFTTYPFPSGKDKKKAPPLRCRVRTPA